MDLYRFYLLYVTSNTLCLQSQLANLFQLFAFFLHLFNESDSGNSKRKIIFLISNSIALYLVTTKVANHSIFSFNFNTVK